MIANGVADSFINSGLQRRYDARPTPASSSSGRSPRPAATSSGREQSLVGYAQAEGIINTGTGERRTAISDANSLQGASLVALNGALAEATARRVAAEGAYRQARRPAVGPGHESTPGPARRGRRARSGISGKARLAEARPSRDDQPARAYRRAQSADRPRNRAGRGRPTTPCWPNIAPPPPPKTRSGRGSTIARVGPRPARTQHPLRHPAARGRHQPQPLRCAAQRYKEIGVAGGIGTSPISIVDRAESRAAPFKPNLPLNLLAGLALGLLAGIGAGVRARASARHHQDPRGRAQQAWSGLPRRDPQARRARAIVEDLEDRDFGGVRSLYRDPRLAPLHAPNMARRGR